METSKGFTQGPVLSASGSGQQPAGRAAARGSAPTKQKAATQSSLWAQPVGLAFLEHCSANPCPSSQSNRFPSRRPSRQASPDAPRRHSAALAWPAVDGQRTQWAPAALPGLPCRHCLSSTNLFLPGLNKDHPTSHSSSGHGPANQSPQQTLIS